MSNKKNLLYVIGGIIGFVLFIVIAVIIIVSNEKIMYGEKYYDEYNNQYFLFKSDGTCEGTSNIVDCNYVLDSDTLVVTTHIDSQGVLDYNPEYIYEFEIVEKNKIKRVKMTMFGYESTDGMGDIWEVGGSSKKSTTTTKKNVPFKKSYTVLTNNGGQKGEILFDNDNICYVDFTNFNNSKNVSGTTMSVKYIPGECTYKMLDDYNLEISYTGYGALYNNYYDYSTGKYKDYEAQKWNIFDGMRIKFNNDYSKFDILNGEYSHTSGEVYFYIFKKDNDYKENITTTTTTSRRVTNNPTTNDVITNKKTTSKTTLTTKINSDKAVIDPNLKVSLERVEYDGYTVVLKTSDKSKEDNSYWVYINGEEYHSDTSDGKKRVGSFTFNKIGKHCLNVSVKDRYNASKDFGSVCINFTPEKLDYSARIEETPAAGKYVMYFRNNKDIGEMDSNHYNYISNVTIYFDGEKVHPARNETFYSGVFDTCNHTIKVVNRFGEYQTLKLTC